MSRRWVVNASPIISLGRIGNLWLLEKLCTQLVAPGAVADKLMAGPDGDPARTWIEGEGARHVAKDVTPNPRMPTTELGAGETSVIAFAVASGIPEVVLDDLDARRAAVRLGLKPVGTFSVLIHAKKEGLVPAVAPLLQRLIGNGMRVSKSLVEEILALAEESFPRE